MSFEINSSFVEIGREEQLTILGGRRINLDKKKMEEAVRKIRNEIIKYDIEGKKNAITSGTDGTVGGVIYKYADILIGDVSAETNFGLGRYHCYNMCSMHNK